jgi:hypothetical protein
MRIFVFGNPLENLLKISSSREIAKVKNRPCNNTLQGLVHYFIALLFYHFLYQIYILRNQA